MSGHLGQFEAELMDERIKTGVDYSFTFKYGQLRILCHEVFVPTIQRIAERCGITVHEYLTYSQRSVSPIPEPIP